MSERLESIKKTVERCDNQHPAFEHYIQDELKEMYDDGDIRFLVEQAEMFESLSEHHDGALAENKRLREALNFYANEDNNLLVDGENTNVSIDSGKIARKALGVEEE